MYVSRCVVTRLTFGENAFPNGLIRNKNERYDQNRRSSRRMGGGVGKEFPPHSIHLSSVKIFLLVEFGGEELENQVLAYFGFNRWLSPGVA